MADPQVECCGNCRFWFRAKPEFKEGLCRRRPPTPIPAGISQGQLGAQVISTGIFPPTRPELWCGEFEWSSGTTMAIDDRLAAPAEGAA